MKQPIDLMRFECEYIEKGFRYIGGIDEAGRGPLAGPVTCACCVLDLETFVEGVNDSKKLTTKKREELFEKIKANSLGYSIIDIDHTTIDEINILNATKMGMKKAAQTVFPIPDMLFIDAVKEDFGIPSLSIIHGDALSYSIAAASILAKVHRDKLMEEYADLFPQYRFDLHKGYGTKLHIELLKKYGPCPIHRKTFIKNFI